MEHFLLGNVPFRCTWSIFQSFLSWRRSSLTEVDDCIPKWCNKQLLLYNILFHLCDNRTFLRNILKVCQHFLIWYFYFLLFLDQEDENYSLPHNATQRPHSELNFWKSSFLKGKKLHEKKVFKRRKMNFTHFFPLFRSYCWAAITATTTASSLFASTTGKRPHCYRPQRRIKPSQTSGTASTDASRTASKDASRACPRASSKATCYTHTKSFARHCPYLW